MLKKTPSILTIAFLGLCTLGPMNLASGQDQVADNDYWWPNRLSLEPLRQNSLASDPLRGEFNYAEAFESLDLEALTADLEQLMTT